MSNTIGRTSDLGKLCWNYPETHIWKINNLNTLDKVKHVIDLIEKNWLGVERTDRQRWIGYKVDYKFCEIGEIRENGTFNIRIKYFDEMPCVRGIQCKPWEKKNLWNIATVYPDATYSSLDWLLQYIMKAYNI